MERPIHSLTGQAEPPPALHQLRDHSSSPHSDRPERLPILGLLAGVVASDLQDGLMVTPDEFAQARAITRHELGDQLLIGHVSNSSREVFVTDFSIARLMREPHGSTPRGLLIKEHQ